MNEQVLLWKIQIRITQAPQPAPTFNDATDSDSDYQETEKFRTFLISLFGVERNLTYGLEIRNYEKLEFIFFTVANSESEATEIGFTWLTFLKANFIGLDGEIRILPITLNPSEDWNMYDISELVLPEGHLRYRIKIIEFFTTLFFLKTNYSVKLLIYWKRDTESGDYYSNLYNLRIFIVVNTENIEPNDLIKIKGILKFLCIKIETISGERAKLIKPSDVKLFDLFNMNLFNEYNERRTQIIKEHLVFDFPESLPLPKIPILDNENVRYIDLNEQFKKRAIKIGNHIKNGLITQHNTYLGIDKLPQDIVVFGKSGSGKTYFLVHFIQEIIRKTPETGVLILNIAKESQDSYYKNLNVLKYGDKEFNVPYFLEGISLEKSLLETASYICASLGLKNVFEKMIYYTELAFIKQKGKLPNNLIDLLRSVEKYLESNPYGNEVQSNFKQALRNRINVLNEDTLKKIVEIQENLPDWIERWLNGENFFIDLSMCNKYSKFLIINSIFQVIRSSTHDFEEERLNYLIVIDEAHAILEKPITRNSDDADFIMKEQMAKIFSELLKEYRSRGIGFIIADQSPSDLFDIISSQPSIKVIFREDYPNNQLFSENANEREMLTQLPNRIALVLNGTTGEKYLMKSIDYETPKQTLGY